MSEVFRFSEKTLRKLEHTELSVRNHVYILLTLYSEKTYLEIGMRQAVFLAERKQDGKPAVIKIRIQMDPGNIPNPDHRNSAHEFAHRTFQDEVQALMDTSSLRSTPTFFGEDVRTQDLTFENPGGYLNIIAMSRMPGMPVTEYIDLSDAEATLIKRSLMQILEEIRLAGWYMLEGYPDKVIYERPTRKISVTCLGHAERRSPDITTFPFDEDNSVLQTFGQDVWWY